MNEENTRKTNSPKAHYKVIQLEWDRRNGFYNEPVSSFDDLVTHHPHANRNAEIIQGLVLHGEDGRKHALVGAEIQEIEIARPGKSYGLKPAQVLIKKDFILEDPNITNGFPRRVDVPSPVQGYVGLVNPEQGLVDIYDHPNGDVIARIRHMHPIHVTEGQVIVQGNKKTDAVHVHIEMDTRCYQQFDNYLADLTSGRLDIDPARRSGGIAPLPIVDDGTFRIGETNHRIQEFQELLISQGVRGASPNADGIYRPEMQPTVLAYQRDHGLAQTGDIDSSTLHVALPHRRGQPIERLDHVGRTHAPFAPSPDPNDTLPMLRPGPADDQRHPDRPRNDPRHPEHRDHAFFELLKRNLPPGTSDEMVAHVLLEAKIGKVQGTNDVERIMVHEDRVFVMGKTPGFRTAVDLAQTPPPIQETAQRSDAFDAERSLQRQHWMAQEQSQTLGRSI